MWAQESLFYHIYPLGMCEAPRENDGVCVSRIMRVIEFIPHLKKLGVGAVYFSPVFESDRHGYDTRDYTHIDCRLGTNEDFRSVCTCLHTAGIRVILDGVFNHVGRGFAPFCDVLKNRENSRYRDWFYIRFDGNTPYNDGLWYECWEGHYELVKLNLTNPEVRDYLFEAVRSWIETFDIDGIRLDVAYCLDRSFIEALSQYVHNLKADFFLFGEMLFGDYGLLVREGMLDSCTNYENYKSLYSALNSKNLYELTYSLNRQFGYEQWCIYRGKHLITFLDNHDVSRIATILTDKSLLEVAYGLLFTMPGIPTLYYGDEWGIEGDKNAGDDALRIPVAEATWNNLTDKVSAFATMRRQTKELSYGGYRNLVEGNEYCLFERACDGDCVLVGVNISDTEQSLSHSMLCGEWQELPDATRCTLDGSLTLKPKSIKILRRHR